ncbi:hypothetical protein AG1IA_01465 [Rhizoctonia solani AG-1 IA]|uniref:Uncharacterized protein n=1 Tax=Thanatephorus cucumeris (strain AG1-IA) TaxID=983506 RepID=L8X641_THACA|nr:hypothetical protein AG1IA_01465 [Rhizoctonia solani AG-1 IA]
MNLVTYPLPHIHTFSTPAISVLFFPHQRCVAGPPICFVFSMIDYCSYVSLNLNHKDCHAMTVRFAGAVSSVSVLQDQSGNAS